MSKVHKSFEVVVGSPKRYMNSSGDSNVISYDFHQKESVPPVIEKETVNAQMLLDKAKLEAAKIIEDAHREGNQIIHSARSQIEDLRKTAWQEGFTQGKDQGYWEGLAQHNEKIEAAEKVYQNAVREKNEIIRQSEMEMVELCINIAEKIVNYELDHNAEAFQSMVHNAIERMIRKDGIVMRVSPYEYDKACQLKEKHFTKNGSADHIEVIQDEFLEKGTCFIESSTGIIDASVQAQLEKIKASFQTIAGSEV